MMHRPLVKMLETQCAFERLIQVKSAYTRISGFSFLD